MNLETRIRKLEIKEGINTEPLIVTIMGRSYDLSRKTVAHDTTEQSTKAEK
jgi:hypothetical protein